MTRNGLAARNNEAYGQDNGRQSLCTILRYPHKSLFKLELEVDYSSETSLCTLAPSPTDTLSQIFFFLRGGGGCTQAI